MIQDIEFLACFAMFNQCDGAAMRSTHSDSLTHSVTHSHLRAGGVCINPPIEKETKGKRGGKTIRRNSLHNDNTQQLLTFTTVNCKL